MQEMNHTFGAKEYCLITTRDGRFLSVGDDGYTLEGARSAAQRRSAIDKDQRNPGRYGIGFAASDATDIILENYIDGERDF
jgi:hypothetical protein